MRDRCADPRLTRCVLAAQGLLMNLCDRVDLLEQDVVYLDKAKELLGDRNKGLFVHDGVQTFEPQEGLYKIIWVQWVALYLTDEDMISFLHRCRAALAEGGCIFFKENTTTVVGQGQFIVDKEDNSITRSDAHYKRLFDAAGMELLREGEQEEFPKELFDVKMYCVR